MQTLFAGVRELVYGSCKLDSTLAQATASTATTSTQHTATANTPQCSRARFPRTVNCTRQSENRLEKKLPSRSESHLSAGSSSRDSSSAHTRTTSAHADGNLIGKFAAYIAIFMKVSFAQGMERCNRAPQLVNSSRT